MTAEKRKLFFSFLSEIDVERFLWCSPWGQQFQGKQRRERNGAAFHTPSHVLLRCPLLCRRPYGEPLHLLITMFAFYLLVHTCLTIKYITSSPMVCRHRCKAILYSLRLLPELLLTPKDDTVLAHYTPQQSFLHKTLNLASHMCRQQLLPQSTHACPEPGSLVCQAQPTKPIGFRRKRCKRSSAGRGGGGGGGYQCCLHMYTSKET